MGDSSEVEVEELDDGGAGDIATNHNTAATVFNQKQFVSVHGLPSPKPGRVFLNKQ
jgi:hypothetical protein